MPRLHPREQSDDDTRVVWRATVDGPARPTREKAHEEAIAQAAAEIREELGLQREISSTEVANMVSDERENTIELGAPNGTAQKYSLDIKLTAKQARELANDERIARVNNRLEWLSRIVAVLVAGLFAVAGYVRLDDWSKGYYTRTLKSCALAAVAAAAFLVWKNMQ